MKGDKGGALVVRVHVERVQAGRFVTALSALGRCFYAEVGFGTSVCFSSFAALCAAI